MPVTVLCTLRRAWGTAGGPVALGLSLELGTPRILLHGSWPLCHCPAPQHQSTGPHLELSSPGAIP